MRKLHCLLMGPLLPIGHGLFAQAKKATDQVPILPGSPIPKASVPIKIVRACIRAAPNGSFTIPAAWKGVHAGPLSGFWLPGRTRLC